MRRAAREVIWVGCVALALASCTAHPPADSQAGGLTASSNAMPAPASKVATAEVAAPAVKSAPPMPSEPASPVASPAPTQPTATDAPTQTATGSRDTQPRALDDTPAGDSPALDPDEIYVIGDSSEVAVAGLQRPYGIAALSAPDRGITGIPLFANVWIRRTDGHIVYSYLGTAPDGQGQTSNLFEFKRDKPPYPNSNDDWLTAGESVVDDAHQPCGPVTSGYSVRYRIGLDGRTYHTCDSIYEQAHRTAAEARYEAWYDASGKRVYFGSWAMQTIGANGRALMFADSGAWAVIDLDGGGTVLGSAMPMKPAVMGQGFNGGAVRSREDGFWLAFTAVDYMNPEALWTELDLSGNTTGQGSYAPLPDGTTMAMNTWGESWPALDAQGALYQFVQQGDELVIVRRPMHEGTSVVVYRQSSWDASHPHDVQPQQLLTGI